MVFARKIEGQQYQMALYLRDRARNNDDPVYFRWPLGTERPVLPGDLDDPVILIQLSAGPLNPYGLPLPPDPDGGWHQAVVDTRGHLWVGPEQRTVVALDTGEAIEMSALQELTWWPVRMPYRPYPDLITFCGRHPGSASSFRRVEW